MGARLSTLLTTASLVPAGCEAMNSVEDVLEANRLSRAAGQQLLADLPLQLKLRARLKSLTLLMIIASCFWVSCGLWWGIEQSVLALLSSAHC